MSRTEAQVAASRANGARSKGPKSDPSKSASRLNALKHGMAARALKEFRRVEAEAAGRAARATREIPSEEVEEIEGGSVAAASGSFGAGPGPIPGSTRMNQDPSDRPSGPGPRGGGIDANPAG